jgi:hypothetical protein
MIVTVQELGQSKGGKPKCKANNVWYFLPTDRDTGHGDSPAVGQVIEVRTGYFMMGDTRFETIEAWRPVQAQPQQAPHAAQAQQVSTPVAPAQQAKPADITQAFIGQGFISNVVGQAIAAKTITEPGQILSWFNAAKLALEGKPSAEPFNDRVSREPDDNKMSDRSKW